MTSPTVRAQKPRRVSIAGTRPCMEHFSSSLDFPIARRRVSIGGTRPCMNIENSTGSLQPLKKKPRSHHDDGPRGRFGGPERSKPDIQDSPKQPRRKGSFDGDSEEFYLESATNEESEGEEDEVEIESEIDVSYMSSELDVSYVDSEIDFSFSSRSEQHRDRQMRMPRGLRNIDSGFDRSDSTIKTSEDYYHQHEQQQQEDPFSGIQRKFHRRASTGTPSLILTRPCMESSCTDSVDEPVRFRRVSIAGTRPCMESSRPCMEFSRPCMESSFSLSDDPIMQRRLSIGGTRPCMEQSSGSLNFSHDGPILRPYRQLSSEHLCIQDCIGEETDEDLSNRSMLRSADRSNRSNRSSFRTIDNADLSSRSNRSNRSGFNNNAEDFSNRSMIRSADLSNRSNRSTFQNVNAFAEEPMTPLEEDTSHHFTPATVSEEFCPFPTPQDEKQQLFFDDSKLPSSSKSKTWPNNLKSLLSIRRLSLRSLRYKSEKDPHHGRKKGKSYSPSRKNNLLQTIRTASEVMEEKVLGPPRT